MPALEDLLKKTDLHSLEEIRKETHTSETKTPEMELDDKKAYLTQKKAERKIAKTALRKAADKLINAIMEDQKQKNPIPQPPQNLGELKSVGSEKKKNQIEITDQNFKFQLFGTPQIFELANFSGDGKANYGENNTFYQRFDDIEKEDKTFEVYQKKDGKVIYVYKKNNLFTNSNRGGGFLAMAVELDKITCTNPQKLYRLLNSVFEVFLKEEEYFLSGNKINVESFKGQEEKIKKLKEIIKKNLNNFSAQELKKTTEKDSIFKRYKFSAEELNPTETAETTESKKIIKKENETPDSQKESDKDAWTAEDEKTLEETMNEITQLTQRMKIQEELEQLKAELARIEEEEKENKEIKTPKTSEKKIFEVSPVKFFSVPNNNETDSSGNGKFYIEVNPELGVTLNPTNNSYYCIDKDNNLYIYDTTYIKRAIENIENYLLPACEIENFSDRKTASGIEIIEPGKIDSRGNVIKKIKIRLIPEREVRGIKFNTKLTEPKRETQPVQEKKESQEIKAQIEELEKERREKLKIQTTKVEIKERSDAMYLKSKSGTRFNRTENSPENSFFRIFDISGDKAKFEYFGNDEEAIAKRIFRDDILEVDGSMEDAEFVNNLEPGELKKDDDGWIVVKKAGISLGNRKKEKFINEIYDQKISALKAL
jgi:hypothetical protein